MRKRKSPIFLITTLAVMASVAFGLQFVSSKVGGAGAEAPPPPPPSDIKPVGTPRAPETKDSVAASIKMAASSGAQGSPEGEGAPMGRPGGPMTNQGPLVVKPAGISTTAPKPVPNSSSTSSHWYDKDSMMGNEK